MATTDAASGGPVVVRVDDRVGLPAALAVCGLSGPRPVVVSIGGAAGISASQVGRLEVLLRDHILPLLAGWGAVVVDGGTDSGVMRAMGRARRDSACEVPLVGVAAEGTVRVPGRPIGSDVDAAELEPNHSVVLLVPGDEWGDESPWIASVADALGGPGVSLLVNGGEIAFEDVRHSVDAGRPVLVAAGTGRTADALAAALRGEPSDVRAEALARSGLLRAVDVTDPRAILELLGQLLEPGVR